MLLLLVVSHDLDIHMLLGCLLLLDLGFLRHILIVVIDIALYVLLNFELGGIFLLILEFGEQFQHYFVMGELLLLKRLLFLLYFIFVFFGLAGYLYSLECCWW